MPINIQEEDFGFSHFPQLRVMWFAEKAGGWLWLAVSPNIKLEG